MKHFSIFTGNTIAKKALSIVLLFSYVVIPLTPIIPVAQVQAATLITIPDLKTVPSEFNNGEIGGSGFSMGVENNVVKGSGSIGFRNDQATKDKVCQIAEADQATPYLERTNHTLAGYAANTDGVAVTSNVNDCGQATIVSWDGTQWVGTECSSAGSEYVTQVSCGPVTEIVDVCTNIDGVQASVPNGYTTDGSGNCTVNSITPAITFNVNPTSISAGGTSNLSWNTTNASSCTASGGWSGTKTLSGSEQTAVLSSNTSFTLTCVSSTGTEASSTVSVTVIPTPGNEAPSAPTIVGTTTGIVGTSYDFTFTSTDPEGDMLAYGIDWDNNGTIDESTNEVTSGNSSTTSHIWDTTGIKTFSVIARDMHLADSAKSYHTIDIAAVPAALITFSANPTSISSGGTSNLTWSTTYASSCVASGAWTGTKAPSGSEQTSVLTSDSTFVLTCTNSAGSSTVASVSVTVIPTPGNEAPSAPTIVGTTTGIVGTSYDFTFTSTDPEGDMLAYGIDWDNNGTIDESTNEVTSGNSSTTSHIWDTTGIKTFSVIARDMHLADSAKSYHTIDIAAVPVVNPTGTFTASTSSVPRGDTVTLTWNVQNADGGCTANGGWSGNKATASSEVTGAINADTTYNLVCSNSTGGSRTFSVTVTAFDPDYTPVIGSFTASPTSVAFGGYSTLDWSVSNASTCAASAVPVNALWSGSKNNVSGTERIEPINATTTFTLTCAGLTGISTSSSVTVNVGTTTGTTTSAVIVTVPTDPSTTELGSSIAYTVYLASRPLADVTMTVNSSDYTEGTTSVRTLTFTPDNWSVYQTVNVAGIDDTLSDGDVVYSLVLGATQSVDINYNNLPAQSFNITNIDNEAPVNPVSFVSFTATPGSVAAGGSATLAWVATGTISSCEASGAWSGTKSATGTEVVGSIFATSTYTIVCTGLGGTATSSVVVGVDNGGGSNGTSTVSFLFFNASPLTVVSGGTSTLSWNATGTVATCTAAGGWSGTKSATGTEVVGPLATTTAFTMVCASTDGTSATSTVTVTVDNGGNNNGSSTVSILSFTATPSTVSNGGSATLSWTATGTVASCSASGGWSGTKSATGTEVVGPLSATTNYTLVCTSTDGSSATSTVTVTVDNGGGSRGGGGGGGGGGHRHCVPGITIPGLDCPVEATTTVIVDQAPITKSGVCQYADFITTFMKKGADNNPDEVTKLQYFLNEYEGAALDLSGIFDDATENAVKDFQAKYASDILEPWGTTTPTGIVYITTTLKINTIFCTAHPDYNGTIEIKDKTITNVLDTATTTPEFEGAIGAATTTLFGFDNIAGIFGALTSKLLGFLKNIPWYLFTISLLAIIGSVVALGKELKTKFKKEATIAIKDISEETKNGLKLIAVATVFNVLNTVSFMADWTGFNTFADIHSYSLPVALVINMVAILAGFASLSINLLNRKA